MVAWVTASNRGPHPSLPVRDVANISDMSWIGKHIGSLYVLPSTVKIGRVETRHGVSKQP